MHSLDSETRKDSKDTAAASTPSAPTRSNLIHKAIMSEVAKRTLGRSQWQIYYTNVGMVNIVTSVAMSGPL